MRGQDANHMSVRPTMLLVDDHDVVRAGTRALIDGHFDVVGEADDVRGAIELAEERNPDVVLLDVRLPGGGGVTVAERLRTTRPDMCLIAFSVSSNHDDVRAMLNAGVDGYLTKTAQAQELVELITAAIAGARPISKEVAGYLLDIDDEIDQDPQLSRLTVRERQVVDLIARGYSYRESATDLGISTKTLESHMGNIFKKLGVASRHQLTARYGDVFVHPDREPRSS
jgi:DNA-binding NarL/FixJ family response regulator